MKGTHPTPPNNQPYGAIQQRHNERNEQRLYAAIMAGNRLCNRDPLVDNQSTRMSYVIRRLEAEGVSVEKGWDKGYRTYRRKGQ